MNKKADKIPELQLEGALELSPSPERHPITFRERYGHFIDGKRVAGQDAALGRHVQGGARRLVPPSV